MLNPTGVQENLADTKTWPNIDFVSTIILFAIFKWKNEANSFFFKGIEDRPKTFIDQVCIEGSPLSSSHA